MAARSLSALSIIRIQYNHLHSTNKRTSNNLLPHPKLQTQWLRSMSNTNLSLRSSNPSLVYTRQRPPIAAAISSSLPTANPDRVEGADKIPKWSSKAIKSFAMSELEARKIKSPTTGTEAILMGILIEGTSFASKFLRANGITLLKVRDEITKLRGKPDMYFFSPEHPPLTEAAQRAIDWAFDLKLKSGNNENDEITTTHLLLGLWGQEESPGHQILAGLGFNEEKAKVLRSLISEAGFSEGQ